ncbi:hypothetical protein WCD74_11635 [Actinomycetospora sp. OC33-EN08]|uniref:Zinc-binding domain-containing protein n=1 Tax=Actinomycetospora aurantiaca TaxID=3129233 RepID=A0ABU8MM98_9PSEU
MRSYGRGFVTAVDPYRDNGPDEDGDVRCRGCGLVFPGFDELRAAGLLAYPERCRGCREEDRLREGVGGPSKAALAVLGAWNGPRGSPGAVR